MKKHNKTTPITAKQSNHPKGEFVCFRDHKAEPKGGIMKEASSVRWLGPFTLRMPRAAKVLGKGSC